MKKKARLIIFETLSEIAGANVIEKIKSYPDWARIADNAWMIVSSDSNSTIRDSISPVMDKGIGLLVIDITDQSWATTSVPKEVTDWMKEKLKQ